MRGVATLNNGERTSSPLETASFQEMDILVVDNHDLVREALVSLLEKDTEIGRLDAVSSLEEGDRITRDPNVIIVDPLSLADKFDPADLVTRLQSRFPASQILVLTDSNAPQDVQSCLAAGARGYMLKRSPGFDLREAVRKVAKGEEYLQPSLGALLLKSGQDAKGPREAPVLNRTEADVLRLLAMGHTNVEVAGILSFGVRTVEGYRSRLMSKLGAKTRAELVRAAVNVGLLDIIERHPKGDLERHV